MGFCGRGLAAFVLGSLLRALLGFCLPPSMATKADKDPIARVYIMGKVSGEYFSTSRPNNIRGTETGLKGRVVLWLLVLLCRLVQLTEVSHSWTDHPLHRCTTAHAAPGSCPDIHVPGPPHRQGADGHSCDRYSDATGPSLCSGLYPNRSMSNSVCASQPNMSTAFPSSLDRLLCAPCRKLPETSSTVPPMRCAI